MHKIKVLFLSMTIAAMALTAFQSIAAAAQVTRINTNRGFIFIDGSIAEGFVMGAKVCFYTSSGEKITCGRIEQASKEFARVKVNNRIAKKIQYGMTATLSKDTQKEKKGLKPCTTDSECGDAGFCFEGSCRQK